MDALSNKLPPAANAALGGTGTGSYLDFDALGRLKGKAAKDGKSAARETAQQFEALFLQMMMKSMRDASFKSDLVESQAKDTFEGMFDKEVSLAMAKKNTLGLADMLIKNMPDPAVQAANAQAIKDLQEQQVQAPSSTASVLQARATAGKGFSLLVPQAAPLSLQPVAQSALPLPRVGGPMPLSAAQRPLAPAAEAVDANTSTSDGARP
jgi:Rod binding domain-containing protein